MKLKAVVTKAGQKQAWTKVTKPPPCSLLLLVSVALRNKHTYSVLGLISNSAVREIKPSAQAQLCYFYLSWWGRKAVKEEIPQAWQPLVHSFVLPRKPALKNSCDLKILSWRLIKCHWRYHPSPFLLSRPRYPQFYVPKWKKFPDFTEQRNSKIKASLKFISGVHQRGLYNHYRPWMLRWWS